MSSLADLTPLLVAVPSVECITEVDWISCLLPLDNDLMDASSTCRSQSQLQSHRARNSISEHAHHVVDHFAMCKMMISTTELSMSFEAEDPFGGSSDNDSHD